MLRANVTFVGWILASVLAVLSTGCATPEPRPTESAMRDTAYQGTLDRIVVVLDSNDLSVTNLGRDFQPRFVAAMRDQLKPRGVSVESITLGPDELDPNTALRAAIARHRSTHALHVALTGLMSLTKPNSPEFKNLPPSRWVENLKFSFQLHDAILGKVVWRGDLTYPAPPTPESLATRFVDSLGTERFLRAAH